MAVPEKRTSWVAPPETIVALATQPAETSSEPALSNVVPLATPPDFTASTPWLETVVASVRP